MKPCAVMRVAKLKGAGKIRVAAAHNKRILQAELGSRGHIDPLRIALNESLHGAPTPAEVAEYGRARMAAAGIGKLRKDAVLAIEWLFSLPANHGIDEGQFFREATAWLAARCGGWENILSADIHRDESAPHCHVLVLPLLDGRMVGSELIGGRHRLALWHSEFHSAVARQFGLARQPKRLFGAAKAMGVKRVLERLTSSGDSVLRSAVWLTIRDRIESEPAPFLAALGLELPQAKPTRSMVQIFTSKGKGGEVEREYRNL